jgi:uncharacterized protein YbjT (DUF2867 family)
MTTLCPFLHYVTEPRDRNSNGYIVALKAVEAAIQASWIAELLLENPTFIEAYPFTLFSLMLSAVTLLTVELGAPADFPARDQVAAASKVARALLRKLAKQNAAAGFCLSSLQVCSPRDA